MGKRPSMVLTVIIVVAMWSGVVAFAETVSVFAGSANTKQLVAWGNGKISLSDHFQYKGSSTLEIQTKGYHEGGRFTLETPVDLAPYLQAAEKSYVVVKVRAVTGPATGATPGRGGPAMPGLTPAPPAGLPGVPFGDAGAVITPAWFAQGGMPALPGGAGMMGMPGGGGMPGMATPGGMPGMGAPGPGGMMGGMAMPMPGGAGGMRPAITVTPPRPLVSARVVLLTNKGQLDTGSFVVASLKQDGEWGEVRAQFSKFKSTLSKDEGDVKLQAVLFTGNSVGKVYIGSMELVSE